MAQRIKLLPAMQETQVQSLGWEDPLEKEMATTPVFLPGESHGQRSLAGYSLPSRKESDTTKQLHTHIRGRGFFEKERERVIGSNRLPWWLRWKRIDLCLIPGSGRSPGEENGYPLQYSENFHGQRSLACYSPWGRKESDPIERLTLSFLAAKMCQQPILVSPCLKHDGTIERGEQPGYEIRKSSF